MLRINLIVFKKVYGNYQKIFLYGAGNYAKLLAKYFAMNNWHVNALLISEGEKIQDKIVESIPVVTISQIKMFEQNSCVILAMSEKYHKEAMNNLKKHKCLDIYTFTQDVFEWINVRLELNKLNIKMLPRKFYEKKAAALWSKYQKVEFCELFVSRLGPMLEFIIQRDEERINKKHILQVFIPIGFNNKNAKELFKWDKAANFYLLKKINEKINLITKDNIDFWKYIIEVYSEKLTYSKRYSINGLIKYQMNERRNYQLTNNNIHMNFNVTEESLGQKKMKTMNLEKEYICFMARSKKYFETIVGNGNESQCVLRNCSVENFYLMCKNMELYDMQSVRMGYLVDKEMVGKGIIDYATFYRDEFMDFYLIAKSKFLVCQFSGFHLIAHMFNKPTVIINSFLLSNIQGDFIERCNPNQDIMIVKKIWTEREKRFLKFSEILELEEKFCDLFLLTEFYEKKGYKIIENTPEEIWYVVQEMIERLNGTIRYDVEDIYLQEKLQKMILESVKKSNNSYFAVPMGRIFLKKNKYLLD